MAQYVPNGQLYLCSGIDLDVSYNHTFSKNFFGTQTAQQNFFKSKAVKTYSGVSYVSKNGTYVDVPDTANALQNVTYMCWKTTDIPLTNDNDTPEYIDNKWYYAFVTKVDYLTPNTARVFFTLDVMQTYLFDMQFNECYVKREHCKRWNSDGTPVVNIEDEGLDYGEVYQIVKKNQIDPYLTGAYELAWVVIATTKQIGTAKPPVSRLNVPLQYYYYYIPICTSDLKVIYDSSGEVIVGAGVLIDKLATDPEYVNSVVSVSVTPFIPASVSFTDQGQSIKCTVNNGLTLVRDTDMGNFYIEGSYSTTPTPLTATLANKYADFPEYSESKLLMYPYSFIELATDRGQSMIIRLEELRTNQVRIRVFSNGTAINKIGYVVENYLADDDSLYWQNGLFDNTQNNIPVINDNTATYLQSNKNSMQVAVQNADRTLTTAYQNAQQTLGTSRSNTNVGLLGGVADAVVKGVAVGSMAGPAGGVIGGVVAGLGSMIGTGVQATQELQSANAQYDITTRSAQTANENAVATVMAKYRDAQAIPPTVATQGSEYMFNNIFNCNSLYFYKKTILPEIADRLEDYFRQYGYAVNKLEVPNLHTRQSYNYIQMAVCNLKGNMPMNDKMKIMDIFMNGITFWHGDYIGDYSRSNNEI